MAERTYVDPIAAFQAAQSEALEDIRHLTARLLPDVADAFTARALTERHATIRRAAVRAGLLDVAEIALSAERVYASIVARPRALSGPEITFLTNAVEVLETLTDAFARRAGRAVATELVDDGFDRLLDRLDAA